MRPVLAPSRKRGRKHQPSRFGRSLRSGCRVGNKNRGAISRGPVNTVLLHASLKGRSSLLTLKAAVIIDSLGQRPRNLNSTTTSAVKARFGSSGIDSKARPVSRAFSANAQIMGNSSGVGRAFDEAAPLALQQYQPRPSAKSILPLLF